MDPEIVGKEKGDAVSSNITERLHFTIHYLNFCSKLKISPFLVEKSGNVCLISLLGQFLWFFLILGTYLRLFSLSFFLFQYVSGRLQVEFVDLVLLLFWFLVLLMGSVIHTEVVFHKTEFVHYFQQLFKIQGEMAGKAQFRI